MKQYQERIDELGRLIIPDEVRKHLNIKEKSVVEIMLIGNEIRIAPHYSICKKCNKPIVTRKKSNLCNECARKTKNNNEDVHMNKYSIIKRRVDEFGRVVIPTEYRYALNIEKNSGVVLTIKNSSIHVVSYISSCECSSKILTSTEEHRICDSYTQATIYNSDRNIHGVFFEGGRLIIGPISFALPDRTFVSTVMNMDAVDGVTIINQDRHVVVTVMENTIAENARESIESIFDSETGCKQVEEIEPIAIGGNYGYRVMYENQKTINIECCIDIQQNSQSSTITIWAYTDKQSGDVSIENMRTLFDNIITSFKCKNS